MKVMFNSSLPRAGSTLIQNIFGQNPEFYVTPTSGLLELLYTSRKMYSESLEFKAQDSGLMKNGFRSFCKNGLEGFFKGITAKSYVLDKSRGWAIHYDFVDFFYPKPKMICMVRDLRSVFSSMEKNYVKAPEIDKNITDHEHMIGTTTQKRVDYWSSTQPVGLAIERLQQVMKENKPIHFIRYEDLTRFPEREMKKIYDFFELSYYHNHDYNNVEQLTHEDDDVYGYAGDHNIRRKVEYREPDYNKVLGIELSRIIRHNYSWFFDAFKYKE